MKNSILLFNIYKVVDAIRSTIRFILMTNTAVITLPEKSAVNTTIAHEPTLPCSTDSQNKPVKILYLMPVAMCWYFFVGNFTYQKKNGFQIAVCSSSGKGLEDIVESEQLDTAFEVEMTRTITPIKDIISFWRIFRVMRCYKPTIVVAGNSKGSFFGVIAAFFAGVPIRINQQHGFLLEKSTGIKKLILFIAEYISHYLATENWYVSASLMERCLQYRVAPKKNSKVIHNGSVNGVDRKKFTWNIERVHEMMNLAQHYAIKPGDVVIGFVGRLIEEKGIVVLQQSFEKILQSYPNAKLIIVGSEDSVWPLPEETLSYIGNHPSIILTGYHNDITPYLCLMDIFAFPSYYNEGFGCVVIEASAMGLPVIGANTTGVVNAVVDGETGKIVPGKNVEKLTETIIGYIQNQSLRLEHGINGSRRVASDFVPENIWQAYNADLKEALMKKGLVSNDFCKKNCEPISIDLDKHEQDLRIWLAVKQHLLHNESLENVCQTFQVKQSLLEKLVEEIMGNRK
jgi:glycosyltransferase involved in cell wall biosynthesis